MIGEHTANEKATKFCTVRRNILRLYLTRSEFHLKLRSDQPKFSCNLLASLFFEAVSSDEIACLVNLEDAVVFRRKLFRNLPRACLVCRLAFSHSGFCLLAGFEKQFRLWSLGTLSALRLPAGQRSQFFTFVHSLCCCRLAWNSLFNFAT